ncbi:CYFA0S03e06128g1_1 [Cyberlindnera fabianii]|uniref:CYFA0S03e06128g1_1 n=1 Tax=Cyberlindnera fabianii TaxID=36022 RepID=A0A061AQ51_CYBFA|nr:CYFA0S03e06128g1_1 [Cyberlindnera fabianii]
MAPAQQEKSKRVQSRPCDACAVRRVRCDISTSQTGKCTNCTNHDIECTNVRVRQKSGPKKIKQKTRESIRNLITTTTTTTPAAAPVTITGSITASSISNTALPHTTDTVTASLITPTQSMVMNGPRAFSLKKLLPYFEIYQTWFYGIWPVMSIARSVAILKKSPEYGTVAEALRMTGPDENFEIVIDETNAQEYALCCALCATVARYHNFLKSTDAFQTVENCPDAGVYAQEARRIIFEYQLKSNPNLELLLTSFFLHKYHSNTHGENPKGLIYLRESVSLAHILMLHDPETILHETPLEAHRHKKIYYLLLVTERFISFETNLPVLLEPTIPIPDQEFEEYPDLLYGFISLCRISSATDKQFYVELHTKVLKTDRSNNSMLQIPEINILQDFLQNHSNDLKKQWLLQLQQTLERKIDVNKIVSNAQIVNVMISKAWLQSLGWLIASENFLINPNAVSPPLDDCFSVRFPLKIAQDFLNHVKGLPDFAFESNGPDVSAKLLEIADSLYTFTIMSTDYKDTSYAYDMLSTIYSMVLRYKSNLDLPRALFSKISSLLEARRLSEASASGSIMSGKRGSTTMDLFGDDDDGDEGLDVFEESAKQHSQSPSVDPFAPQIHSSHPHHQMTHPESATSASSVSETRGDSIGSIQGHDDMLIKPEFPLPPMLPPATGMTPTGFTPAGFTPSGFLNTVMSPPTSGMLQKSSSSILLNQVGASLSPFYIPGP